MIAILIFIFLIIALFIINLLLNKKALRQYTESAESRQGRYLIKPANKIWLKPIAIIGCALIVFFAGMQLPAAFQYSSVDSYLFWAECRIGDSGPLGIKAKKDIGDAYIYTVDDVILYGLVVKENNNYKKGNLELLMFSSERVENAVCTFSIYELREIEKKIIIINYLSKYDDIINGVLVNENACDVFFLEENKQSLFCLIEEESDKVVVSMNNQQFEIDIKKKSFINADSVKRNTRFNGD